MVPLFRETLFADLTLELHEKLPVGPRVLAKAHFDDVQVQQNNGGELLALVMALRIALHQLGGSNKDATAKTSQSQSESKGSTSDTTSHTSHASPMVYTDSELVVNSWSLNHVRPVTWHAMDPKKQALVTECVRLRRQFEQHYGGQVLWIPGKQNPADIGYHRDKWTGKGTATPGKGTAMSGKASVTHSAIAGKAKRKREDETSKSAESVVAEPHKSYKPYYHKNKKSRVHH